MLCHYSERIMKFIDFCKSKILHIFLSNVLNLKSQMYGIILPLEALTSQLA